MFYAVLAIIGVLILVLLVARMFVQGRTKNEDAIVLSISVSAANESTPIVFEQIFAAIHGIFRKMSSLRRIFGFRQDRVSFEIANIGGSIKFYVWMPRRLRNFIEGQLYAQYPDIEIEEVEDYSVVRDEESLPKVAMLDLKFHDPDVYPIKRYEQFEDKLNRVPVDPLAGMCSSLSKLQDGTEQAWIQIVAMPLRDKWRTVYSRCLNIVNKGLFLNVQALQNRYIKAYTTRKTWPKVVFFPLYFYFWMRGLLSSSKSSGLVLGGGERGIQTQNLDDEIRTQHNRETSLEAAMDKVNKLLFDVSIRVAYVPTPAGVPGAEIKLREIAGSFKQFNLPNLNGFEIKRIYTVKNPHEYTERQINHGMVMSIEELATVYHFPHESVKTPNIHKVRSKKLEPPLNLPTDGTTIGETNFRDTKRVFGISDDDRRRHFYIIGKTGMGKSTLLENMIFSDIERGAGVAVVDPHGDLADAVLRFVPANRTNDVILFDPTDRDFPVGFNMLENKDDGLNAIVASGLVGVFKKLYAHSWGPRLEHILRNTVMALLEYPGTTMLGIPRMLTDDKFRKQVVKKIEDPLVKQFWEKEFGSWNDKQKTEAVAPILNKVGQFLSSPDVRNILGQVKSSIDFRFAMDKGKIVIINLSKGKLGEDNSSLLGSMIITKFQLDAMSRADISSEKRKDFYLYVDEFQNFATDAFANILSEARKYKLNLIMANQYIAQMPEEVRDAVFGNVGSLLSMQVGFDDADYLVGQYGEEVEANDLVSLNKYTAYMRLLVDGMPTPTFSLATLPPPKLPDDVEERVEKIVKVARERYATPREDVEGKIKRWSSND